MAPLPLPPPPPTHPRAYGREQGLRRERGASDEASYAQPHRRGGGAGVAPFTRRDTLEDESEPLKALRLFTIGHFCPDGDMAAHGVWAGTAGRGFGQPRGSTRLVARERGRQRPVGAHNVSAEASSAVRRASATTASTPWTGGNIFTPGIVAYLDDAKVFRAAQGLRAALDGGLNESLFCELDCLLHFFIFTMALPSYIMHD